MDKIAQFEKVSYKQFMRDYIDIFKLKPESYELVKIEKVIARCKEALERNMQSANIPVSLMIYNGIPKRFKDPSYII